MEVQCGAGTAAAEDTAEEWRRSAYEGEKLKGTDALA